MSFISMISVEGVLAQGEDLKTTAPQKWARPLYDGIRSQFRTIALDSEFRRHRQVVAQQGRTRPLVSSSVLEPTDAL